MNEFAANKNQTIKPLGQSKAEMAEPVAILDRACGPPASLLAVYVTDDPATAARMVRFLLGNPEWHIEVFHKKRFKIRAVVEPELLRQLSNRRKEQNSAGHPDRIWPIGGGVDCGMGGLIGYKACPVFVPLRAKIQVTFCTNA